MRKDRWAVFGRRGRRPARLAAVLAGTAAAVAAIGAGAASADAKALSGALGVSYPATQMLAWHQLISDFKAANPGVTVNETMVPFSSYFQVVQTELQAGSGPDVMYVPPGSGTPLSLQNAAAQRVASPLTNLPWAKHVPASYKADVTYKGKVYALANGAYPGFLLINKDAFAKVGVSVPKTMDDLLSMCKTISAKGYIPMAIGGQDTGGLVNFLVQLLGNYVDGPNPNFTRQVNAGKASIATSKGWHEAVQRIVDLKNAGCFDRNVAGDTRSVSDSQFATGKALMYPVLGPQVSTIKALKPKFKWSVAPLPGDTVDSTYLITVIDPLAIINSKTKVRPLAEAFLNFMHGSKESATFNKVQNTVSPVDFAKGKVPSFMAPLKSMLKPGGHSTLGDPNYWKSASTYATLTSELAGLLTGQKTVDAIISDVVKTYGK